MSFESILRDVPDYVTLPTVDELHAATAALIARNDPRVEVRTVGYSRTGEVIELISIGHGRHHALLVGTPHPNEPVGCLTIDYLIERLLLDDALAERFDVTWHFIRSIEPDGLRLNEGWLKTPLDPAAYLRDFYRPAFYEQAEYTFPLDTPQYRFDRSTPENLAWQEAIRLVQPELSVSLHNAEYGGAFYILSHDVGSLAQELVQQPPRHGVPLDPFGEVFAEMQSLAPGAFLAPDIAAEVSTPGGASNWTAGDSSIGFCARAGTLSLVVETPYWKEHDVAADAPPISLKMTFAEVPTWVGEAVTMLEQALSLLRSAVQGSDEASLLRSLDDQCAYACRLRDLYAHLPEIELTARDARAQRRAWRLILLRPTAMLRRLAKSIAAREQQLDVRDRATAVEADCADYLANALASPPLVDAFVRTPLANAVRVQLDGILTTAAALFDSKNGTAGDRVIHRRESL